MRYKLKGAVSRGLRGFWAQAILKLVVANLICTEHYLVMSTGRYNLNLQRENKARTFVTILSRCAETT